jgi:cytoskeleton protein RodZ
MTEPAGAGAGPSAGALLRAARERQGLHLVALAAAIKVSPRKLEALEADRYDELPDATFARALAQSVCRVLKIDPRPVLALLPRPDAAVLEQVGGSLNEPFRARGTREIAGLPADAIRPLLWASAALMAGAVVLWLLPPEWFEDSAPGPAASAPAGRSHVASAPGSASAPPSPASPPSAVSASPPASAAPVAPAVAAAPGLPRVASASAVATAETAGATAPGTGSMLALRASGASWVQVTDREGKVLVSRLVGAGETLSLDGALPLRIIVGNAAATELRFRGRTVDLVALARNNVARLELPDAAAAQENR